MRKQSVCVDISIELEFTDKNIVALSRQEIRDEFKKCFDEMLEEEYGDEYKGCEVKICRKLKGE